MPLAFPLQLTKLRAHTGALRLVAMWCGMAATCVCLPGVCGGQVEGRPSADGASQDRSASLHGVVMDQDGGMLPGARIEVTSATEAFVEITDSEGEFFLSGLPAGVYDIRVLEAGFLNGDASVALLAGEAKELTPIELHMAMFRADVTVMASTHEIAAEQVAVAEKQRIFGVMPNFYVVYDRTPAPLSPGQKFHLAWRSTLDPVSFLATGVNAGIEQAVDQFSGYGQGAEGYAKRYGASFADDAIGTFLGAALLPSVLHQDPRYYYQGTGTVWSRTKHAVGSVVICHGDNGQLQFNVSNVLGSFAAAGISNAYYPDTDRHGAGLTMQNAAVGIAFGAFSAMMQEFVVRRLTPHLPSRGTPAAP